MFEPILEVIQRRRLLGVVAFAVPFTAAAALAVSLPNLYRATATVLVQRDKEEPTGGGTSPAVDLDTRLQTIREEVLSRQRLDALIERFNLYPSLRLRAPKEAIVEKMRRDIQIQIRANDQGSAPAGTIAFSLSYRGGDRTMTASVANALAESYVEENLKMRGRQAKGTADALSQQLSEVRERLNEQEARITAYQASHNGELPQQLVINLSRMQQLEMQMQMNRESQLRAMDRRDMIGGVNTLAADPHYAERSGNREAAAARLARLKQELADLRASYNDAYPDIVRIKSQIATLEKSGDATGTDTPPPRGRSAPAPAASLADNSLQSLKDEEARLRGEIDGYRARVDRAPLREQEFAELSRDYATTKDLYGSLLKKYQEAKIADDMQKGNKDGQLRILDSAITPAFPFAPNRQRLLLFGLAASLAFAAGAMMLLERMDTSFHSVDQLRSFTRVPVLVSIPPLKSRYDKWRATRRSGLISIVTLSCLLMIAAVCWSYGRGNLDLVQMLAKGSPS